MDTQGCGKYGLEKWGELIAPPLEPPPNVVILVARYFY